MWTEYEQKRASSQAGSEKMTSRFLPLEFLGVVDLSSAFKFVNCSEDHEECLICNLLKSVSTRTGFVLGTPSALIPVACLLAPWKGLLNLSSQVSCRLGKLPEVPLTVGMLCFILLAPKDGFVLWVCRTFCGRTSDERGLITSRHIVRIPWRRCSQKCSVNICEVCLFIGCSLKYFRDLDVEMELRLFIGLIFVFKGGLYISLFHRLILDTKILNTGTTDFWSKMESLIPYSWLLTCHGLKILLVIMWCYFAPDF